LASISRALTPELHEQPGHVEVGELHVDAGLTQPEQVLAVEPLKLVGDLQLAIGATLDPHTMRVFARADLDERRVPAARVRVAVLQAQRLTTARPAAVPPGACRAGDQRRPWSSFLGARFDPRLDVFLRLVCPFLRVRLENEMVRLRLWSFDH
jgi:hypothetical protein